MLCLCLSVWPIDFGISVKMVSTFILIIWPRFVEYLS